MNSKKIFFKSTTLLITLKDNISFTKKLIKYLNIQSIKINILVADGSKKKQYSLFKNLKHNYKYFYFGEDKNIQDYYLKVFRSLKKIDTKFIFFCDQDDYINFNVLKKKESFLIKNSNFSAAKGTLYNFKNPKKNIISLIGKSYPKELNNKKKLFSRLMFNFHFRSYYCLHRKKNLMQTFKIITKNKITDVRSAEFIMDINTLLFGEVYITKECSLIRWAGNKYGLHPIKKYHDSRFKWFFNKIFKNKFLLKEIILLNKNLNLSLNILIFMIIFFDIIPNLIKNNLRIINKIIQKLLKIFRFNIFNQQKFYKENEVNKIFNILNNQT